MKKLLVILCGSMVIIFGMTGISAAVPTTWVDEIDWDPDQYIGCFSSFDYYHDISDGVDGFVGFLDGGNDFVSTYSLTVSLYDDGGRWDRREIAHIDQPGLLGDGLYNFSYSNQTFGWSLAGLLDINHDGTLNVSIDSVVGDFYLDSSILVAQGDNGTAPVPEPATMLLLGSGLLGLAGMGRKRFFKKA